MRIGIIGAGNVGNALATASVRAGHEVTLSSKDGAKAETAARSAGARAVPTNAAAVEGADIVIPAVWYAKTEEVYGEIGGKLDGKVVIDVTNPLKPDSSGLAVEGESAAERIQKSLPKAHVVKAFNTVLAARQADPQVDGIPVDCLVAGSDGEAKQKVMEFVRSLGMRPIDAGDLSAARYLEALGFLNISLNARNKWSWQNAWKLIGPDTV